jgi:glycerol-3-phosphate O-acyltransferase
MGREQAIQAVGTLVGVYANQIHNQFSSFTYDMATRLMPGALGRLLTASQPLGLFGSDFDPTSRIIVDGPMDLLRSLSEDHTLVIAPTHFSNLDSPLIGFALYGAELPPVIYGAGLNLFANPAMAFFMSRLGAYTVDRRKKHRLYKDVLKDYSVHAMERGCSSLFFPGGTRSRSGGIEERLKKGLLGTGITAWQNNIEAGAEYPDLLVVPCTLSYSLVLEAETLIEDHLAEEGQARYIISDDEFSQPRTVATFARRALSLDASVTVRFGQPLDLVGNPVNPDGTSTDHHGSPFERVDYLTDQTGAIVRDSQRDRVYTDFLAQSLLSAYRRDTTALPTHVAAYAAWRQLETDNPALDPVQLALLSPDEQQVNRSDLITAIGQLLVQLRALETEGAIHLSLPPGPAELLDAAMRRFSHFHSRNALEPVGERIRVDPRLTLFYGNRIKCYDLESP